MRWRACEAVAASAVPGSSDVTCCRSERKDEKRRGEREGGERERGERGERGEERGEERGGRGRGEGGTEERREDQTRSCYVPMSRPRKRARESSERQGRRQEREGEGEGERERGRERRVCTNDSMFWFLHCLVSQPTSQERFGVGGDQRKRFGGISDHIVVCSLIQD